MLTSSLPRIYHCCCYLGFFNESLLQYVLTDMSAVFHNATIQ